MYRAFIQTFAIYEGLPNGKIQILVSAFRIVFLRMSGGLLYFCHLKRERKSSEFRWQSRNTMNVHEVFNCILNEVDILLKGDNTVAFNPLFSKSVTDINERSSLLLPVYVIIFYWGYPASENKARPMAKLIIPPIFS